MACRRTTARHVPSGKSDLCGAHCVLRCGRAVQVKRRPVCRIGANLVHAAVSRIVAVRAALQRCVPARQRAAKVHRRRAFVHEDGAPCTRRRPVQRF